MLNVNEICYNTKIQTFSPTKHLVKWTLQFAAAAATCGDGAEVGPDPRPALCSVSYFLFILKSSVSHFRRPTQSHHGHGGLKKIRRNVLGRFIRACNLPNIFILAFRISGSKLLSPLVTSIQSRALLLHALLLFLLSLA